MDLSFMVGDYKLNVRVGCIIKHNGKILFHNNCNKNHYCLVGGRIQSGEDSVTALKREVMEELNKEIEVKNLAAIIENFFTLEENGTKVHEIYFIYFADFKGVNDKLIDYTMDNKEGKEYLKYYWLDKKDIQEKKILPGVLRKVLTSDKFPVNYIFKNNIEIENK